MTDKSNLEFLRTSISERNTQTLIDGNLIQIKEGDEIKIQYYKLNESDERPISGDIYVNNVLIGCLKIEQLNELLVELFSNPEIF